MSTISLRKFSSSAGIALTLGPLLAGCTPDDYNVSHPKEAGGSESMPEGGSTTHGGSTARGGSAAGGAPQTATTVLVPVDGPVVTSCAADADCAGNAILTVCDKTNNRCAECLAGDTTCTAGLYCTSANRCQLGCETNADCGGTLSCNTTQHVCEGCSTNGDCPRGTRCEQSVSQCLPSCENSDTCPADWTCCGGSCVNPKLDPQHCSACNRNCAVANANATCLEGTCAMTGCTEWHGNCNDKASDGCEVDLSAHFSYCGSCTNSCRGAQVCRNGSCSSPECSDGFFDCNANSVDGCETNTNSDKSNCGACHATCSTYHATPTCTARVCSVACDPNWGDCDKNANNGCEVDLTTDETNCGICDQSCANDHGSTECLAGKCVPTCGSGFGDCDGKPANGCDTALLSDRNNCGKCGSVCALQHATASCTAGQCAVGSCDNGWGDCNGKAEDGCETPLLTDEANCGKCGEVCSSINGTSTCSAGDCVITTCADGYDDCDEKPENGCEVNLLKSVLNCGTCGKTCTSTTGTPTCASATCGVSSCTAPYGNCETGSSSCSTNTSSDPLNCGGCGITCVTPNATPRCSGSKCLVASCAEGYRDCNGLASDGCEVNITTSLDHCGKCGDSCYPSSGVGQCTSGLCIITSCTEGYADCDGNAANGCEVHLKTDVQNCGKCASVCSSAHGSPSCSAGACKLACASGYGDCNNSVADGCETNTTADALNCGSCSKTCAPANATGSCVNSACIIASCSSGFGNCDNAYDNGCEINLPTNANFCGSCTTSCNDDGGAATCASGTCGITCDDNYANCDKNLANGCEINTNADTSNCGSCGNVCGTAIGCTAGQCETPCTGICTPSTVVSLSGSYALKITTAEYCIETTSGIANGGCGNFVDARPLDINGTMIATNSSPWISAADGRALPARRNGGYCFHVAAGTSHSEWCSMW